MLPCTARLLSLSHFCHDFPVTQEQAANYGSHYFAAGSLRTVSHKLLLEIIFFDNITLRGGKKFPTQMCTKQGNVSQVLLQCQGKVTVVISACYYQA